LASEMENCRGKQAKDVPARRRPSYCSAFRDESRFGKSRVAGAASRKKKAPGKAVSQGGRGQQPYPGAIGLSSTCRSLASDQARPRSILYPKRAAGIHANGSASWSAEKPYWLLQCRPTTWILFMS